MTQTNPIYPPQNNAEAIELNIFNAKQFHNVLNGDTETVIPTFEGNADIPSVAKALSDSAAYKTPINWVQGNVQTDLLQPRNFNSFVYVPTSVPQTLGAQPTEVGWKLYLQNIDESSIDQGFNYYREVVSGSPKSTFTLPFTYETETIGNNIVSNMFVTVNGTDIDLVSGVSYPANNQITLTTPVAVGQILQVRTETIATFSIVRDLADNAETSATNAASSASAAAASAASALATEGRITTEGNTQVARVTSTGTTQNNLVVSSGTTGVNDVNSARDSAISVIEALPDFTTNYSSLLDSYIDRILDGSLTGTEGKRRYTGTVSVTPTSISSNTGFGQPSFFLFDSTVVTSINFLGRGADISERDYGIIFGDSLAPYLVILAHGTGSSARGVNIHPKHGNITSDFSVGRGYTVYIFKESSAQADQQTGDLDVFEHYIGGHFSFEERFPNIYQTTGLVGDVTGWAGLVAGDNRTYTITGNTIVSTSAVVSRPGTYIFERNLIKAGDTVTMTGTCSKNVTATMVGYRTDGTEIASAFVISTPTTNLNRTFVVPSNISGTTITALSRIQFVTTDTSTDITTFTGFTLTANNRRAIGDIVTDNDEALLNVGFWNGATFQSQLLSDINLIGSGSQAVCSIKQSRKTSSIQSVEVLREDGTWQSYGFTGSSTRYGFSSSSQINTIDFNVGLSFVDLGYLTQGDMVHNSAVRIRYETNARVWRPSNSNITTRSLDDKVYLFGGATGAGSPALQQDIIGHVPTVNPSSNVNWTRILSSADNSSAVGIGVLGYNPSTPRYLDSNGAAVLFRLVVQSGNLHMQARFKELIRGTGSDWGDNDRIDEDGSDNITTASDDNSQVILRGVMSFDTGISA